MYWMLSLKELVWNFCMCNYFLQYTWADETAGLVLALFLDWKNETKILAEIPILKGKYEWILGPLWYQKCCANECYVTGATSHLQTLTHFHLKELLWQRNLVLLGRCPVFLHELHSSDRTLLVARESQFPFFARSPFLLTSGARV